MSIVCAGCGARLASLDATCRRCQVEEQLTRALFMLAHGQPFRLHVLTIMGRAADSLILGYGTREEAEQAAGVFEAASCDDPDGDGVEYRVLRLYK